MMEQIVKKVLRKVIKNLPFKKQLFSVLKLLNTPKYIYKRLKFYGNFKVKIDSGNCFKLYSHGYSSENKLFWKGLKGDTSLQLWTRLCKEASVIFDVGAHLGIYSIIAATLNPRAQIFGFEPVRKTYNMFVQNVRLNNYNNITCVQKAVGEENGETHIYYDPTALLRASLRSETALLRDRVPVVSLFNFVKENNIQKIDLIKVDVETFEPLVLKGMGSFIKSMKPRIIIEVLNNKIGKEIKRLLGDDYLFFLIDEGNGLFMKHELQRVNKASRNYFCCTREDAEKLGLKPYKVKKKVKNAR